MFDGCRPDHRFQELVRKLNLHPLHRPSSRLPWPAGSSGHAAVQGEKNASVQQPLSIRNHYPFLVIPTEAKRSGGTCGSINPGPMLRKQPKGAPGLAFETGIPRTNS